jgi:hypothetical protein
LGDNHLPAKAELRAQEERLQSEVVRASLESVFFLLFSFGKKCIHPGWKFSNYSRAGPLAVIQPVANFV